MEKVISFILKSISLLNIGSSIIFLIIKSIIFTSIITICMFLFETAGLSFLFKDFLMTKMNDLDIHKTYKLIISIFFSGFASFFCISVVLYIKVNIKEERKFGYGSFKYTEGKIISVVLGGLIFIGYLKGYKLERIENFEFWYEFTLHIIAGLFLSFLSVYTNFLIAHRINETSLMDGDFSDVFNMLEKTTAEMLQYNKDEEITKSVNINSNRPKKVKIN